MHFWEYSRGIGSASSSLPQANQKCHMHWLRDGDHIVSRSNNPSRGASTFLFSAIGLIADAFVLLNGSSYFTGEISAQKGLGKCNAFIDGKNVFMCIGYSSYNWVLETAHGILVSSDSTCPTNDAASMDAQDGDCCKETRRRPSTW